jgi:hypothetical protein
MQSSPRGRNLILACAKSAPQCRFPLLIRRVRFGSISTLRVTRRQRILTNAYRRPTANSRALRWVRADSLALPKETESISFSRHQYRQRQAFSLRSSKMDSSPEFMVFLRSCYCTDNSMMIIISVKLKSFSFFEQAPAVRSYESIGP